MTAGCILFVWSLICLMNMLDLGDVYAADQKRIVRVAFFPMDGYHIVRPDGSYDGMDVAYLKAVSEYVDWDVEYVECESWEKALQLLSDKRVDLVGSAQYSEERAKIYRYADLASGYTFGVIATNSEGTVAYEDFTAMKDIVFGMVKGYVRKNEFLQYLSDNGVADPDIREYSSTAELQQALDNGSIDALVHTFTEIREGQRLIGRFAPRPFYYMTYEGNDGVLSDLNQAIADLKINQPELEAELMSRFYYSKFDKAALLTMDEKSFLASTRLLKVGYLDGHYPFSYKEDGEFKGLSREMLEGSLSVTGQELDYIEMENEGEAKKALLDGTVDILAYCTDSRDVLSAAGLSLVREYADIPLVLVTDRNTSAGSIATVATISVLEDKAGMAVDLEKTSVRIFGTQQQCLDELREGNVDAVLCNGYLAEHLFRTQVQYENLQIKNIFSGGYPVSVAVREDSVLLGGILAKTITDVDSKTISEYMMKENVYPLVSIRSFIRNHSAEIMLCMFAVIILVILVARHIVNDEKKIRKLMYKDTFLDIWNLNYLIYWGEHKLLAEQKDDYAVVSLNLSQFRHYNIIYGWSAGEQLLEGITDMLKQQVDSQTEICARSQGDRFALLVRCDGQEALMKRLDEMKKNLEKKIYEMSDNRMILRFGVYFVPQRRKKLQIALNYANQALDFTGDKEENSIKVYDERLEQMIKERHEKERLLESVDIDKDFAVYYQPKVDIRSGRIVGAEALVRFLNPAENGAVKAPGFFVPYYEQTGRITEIDFFVYETVCRMLRRRLDAGENVVTVSCNFSRMHFIRPGFTERFEEVLSKYRIDKELIEVEITETLVIEELQQRTVRETLDRLREKGIRLSIDDFGAGYSSLGVFEQIPAAVVKLDRSFLLNQQDHERQVKIMRGIVNLTKDLNAQVVCEGVETDEDIRLMHEIGANVAQGYFYSRPIPEKEFEQKLSEESYA